MVFIENPAHRNHDYFREPGSFQSQEHPWQLGVKQGPSDSIVTIGNYLYNQRPTAVWSNNNLVSAVGGEQCKTPSRHHQ
ncbi:MAG TPA: hypothetical protein DCE55_21695 [Planctomycetaceae bacterium]|nr:hypothetical protein [Planctomycetaceae bacterium]